MILVKILISTYQKCLKDTLLINILSNKLTQTM